MLSPARVLLLLLLLAGGLLLLIQGPVAEDRSGGGRAAEGGTAVQAGKPGGREDTGEHAAESEDPAAGTAVQEPESAPERLPADGPLRLEITCLEGCDEGALFVLPLAPEIQEWIAEDLGIHGGVLWEEAGGLETPIADGRALFPETEQDLLFWWAEVPGHRVVSGFLDRKTPPPGGAVGVELEESQPLVVEVVDAEGQPLPGMLVFVMNEGRNPNFVTLPWRERLKRRFFLKSLRTDGEGRAVLDAPLEGGMEVQSGFEGGYAPTIELSARAGTPVRLVLFQAATVEGRVTDPAGQGIPGVQLVFLGAFARGKSGVGGAATDEEGRFRTERLSTASRGVYAAAILEGWEFLLTPILDPRPGQGIRLDLVLRPAVALHLRVQDPEGRPVPGAVVDLRRGAFDWMPATYTADAEGRAVTNALFVPGEPYLAFVELAGSRLPPVTVTAPAEADAEVVLQTPALGRFPPVRVRLADGSLQTPKELRFRAAAAFRGDEARWSGTEASPWLPRVQGTLTVRLASGAELRTEATPEAEPRDAFVLDLRPATLRFLLPEAPGVWHLRARSSSGTSRDLGEARPGPAEVALEPGRWHLEAEGPGGERLRAGPFELGPEGLDLGPLKPALPLALEVRVADAQGRGWPEFRLWLLPAEAPGEAREAVTDRSGRARFEDLLPGVWHLRVRPFLAGLVQVPEQELRVVLGPATPAPPLQITVDPARLLTGRVAPGGPVPGEVFLLAEPSTGWQEVAADGSFTLPAPAEPGAVLGALQAVPGELRLALQAAPPGEARDLFLDPGAGAASLLRFRLPDGRPAAGARADLLLGSRPLGRSVSLDAEGRLAVRRPPGWDLRLRVQATGGGRLVLPLRDAGDRETLVLVPPRRRDLVITDLEGRPLAGALVLAPESGLSWSTDARGRVAWDPAFAGGPLEAHHPGFLPAIASDPGTTPSLRLRRLLAEVVLRVRGAAGARRLELRPLFPPAPGPARFQASLETGAGLPEARFRDLPEGPYSVWLETASGPVSLGQVAPGPDRLEATLAGPGS